MKYKVIKRFKDLEDNLHVYEVGDEYPHKNAATSDKRIAELLSADNKMKQSLIERVEETKKKSSKKKEAKEEKE